MRAVGQSQFGGPETLKLVERDLPDPGPGSLRIRVRAATINPTDIGFVKGYFRSILERHGPPWTPGMELAGEVDALGEGVSDLTVGDRVMAIVLPLGRRGGAQAEYVVVRRESVVRTPDTLTDVEAATVPMNGLTAVAALDILDVPRGGWLWVTGAPGTLGGYTVQLAKQRWLNTVVDVAEKDAAFVHAIGADLVLARGEGVAHRVREALPEGVAGVVDGALLNGAVLPALQDGGRVIAVRPFEGTTEERSQVTELLVADHAFDTARLEDLRAAAESGVVTTRVHKVFPASQAEDAYREAERAGLRGRVVLTFD